MVGTPRRRGLRLCEDGHAEGPSRAAEDVKRVRRLSFYKGHSGSSEEEPWGH